VGSPHKTDLLEREGYGKWIVRSDNFRNDLVAALDGRPLKVIMECIGGRILMDGFKTLAAEGRMVVYGNASFTTQGDRPNKLRMLWRYLRRPKIDPLKLPGNNKSVMGFNLIWLYPQVEKFHRIVEALMGMRLPPPLIGEQFPFDALPRAIRRLQSGQTMGKVVVTVDHADSRG
ncbi:MAG: zinc-binding dehydrogenase, partial [Saprospiraceae bacterium]|nr:zinc-binding dehydrogenase [Saprospiraceae bacterium]